MEDQTAKELHEPEYQPDFRGEEPLEGEDYSATDRAMYVVTAPKRAFLGLTRVKPGSVIMLGMAIAVVLTVIQMMVMTSSESYQEMMRGQQERVMENLRNNPNMSQEDLEKFESGPLGGGGMEQLTRIVTVVGGGFMAIVAMVFSALVMMIIGKVMESTRSTEVGFGQALAVASLAGIVYAIGSLAMTLIAVVADVPVFQGLGGLLGPDKILAGTMVSAIGPNMLWYYVVSGIGIGTIAKASPAKATISFAVVMLIIMFLMGVVGQTFGNGFNMSF